MTAVVIPELAGVARLGRHVEHDARSFAYGVDLLGNTDTHTIYWTRHSPILDQGNLGSCTGNAMTGALGCDPLLRDDPAQYNEDYAVKLYEEATRLDAFPGEYPPDDTGSSGLAVAKAAKRFGKISIYHHAFTKLGILHALQHGPVIIGINWYEGFDTPDSDGVISIAGEVRGGHEVLIRGWDMDAGLLHGDNSWSSRWGANGSFSMTLETWLRLRAERADVILPLR